MNTAFEYLYRDGSNYKKYGHVVFVGEFTPIHEMRIRAALDDGKYFIAHQIAIPEVFHWLTEYPKNEDDHCFHEFFALWLVPGPPTDPRTVEQFVNDVERASVLGWLVWDPLIEDRPALDRLE